MGHAKTVAEGFVAVASAIWLLLCAWVSSRINLWLGVGAFLVLAIPYSARLIVLLKDLKTKVTIQIRVKQAKNALMALQGFTFACWFLDVISTIFVMNIERSGEELNILGWPYAALGALAFYVPVTFAAYYLLFKVKSKESFYATAVLTAVSMFIGLMNLNAGLTNLSQLYTFMVSAQDLAILGIWLAILASLCLFNVSAVAGKGKFWLMGKKSVG
jgi:hypothetical protein